jgi:hypothetical protein
MLIPWREQCGSAWKMLAKMCELMAGAASGPIDQFSRSVLSASMPVSTAISKSFWMQKGLC